MTLFFRLEVTLQDSDPKVWRRLALQAEARLGDLQAAIQDLGWAGHGGWEMISGCGRFLAGFDPEAQVLPGPEDERPLAEVLRRSGDHLLYVYDLDDRFVHEVRHEGMMPGPSTSWRFLFDGAGSFPPEGCGGARGHRRLIRSWLRGRSRGEASPAELGGWRPDGFDLERERTRWDLDLEPFAFRTAWDREAAGSWPVQALRRRRRRPLAVGRSRELDWSDRLE
ncbi:MAG: hypothetical protein H6807_16000 [Planctomycetes bacterium]|nr:hypothetical protein [Planctomycetota bacterium]